MKTTPTNDIQSVLPLLIHENAASLPWAISTINSFMAYAKKAGITMEVIYSLEAAAALSPGSFLLLYGSEAAWLEDILFRLSSLDLRIILLDGEITGKYGRLYKIVYNQESFIQDSLDLLHRNGRYKTAFFGPQVNDTSDNEKMTIFTQAVSPDHIYSFTDTIEPCISRLFKQIDQYDSVICSNDLDAAYLIKCCHKHHISIPEHLQIIGSGNLWISSHMTPSLTTHSCDRESVAIIAIQLFKSFYSLPQANTMDISLKPILLERESTGCTFNLVNDFTTHKPLYQQNMDIHSTTKYEQCPEIQMLNNLDQIFSACSPDTLKILQMLIDRHSYQDISQSVFMTIDSLKYHIQKVYRSLGIHSRQELIRLAQEYRIRFV